MGKHEKVNEKLQKKLYRFPSENPSPLNQTVRSVQLPAVLSVEKKEDAIELCVAHTDNIPRFVNVYASKGKNRQLIAKAYLSEGVDNDCFLLQVSISSWWVPGPWQCHSNTFENSVIKKAEESSL